MKQWPSQEARGFVLLVAAVLSSGYLEPRAIGQEAVDRSIDAKLQQAFGQGCAELSSTHKLLFSKHGLLLAADALILEADGRIRMPKCSIALLNISKLNAEASIVTTVRRKEAFLSLANKVRSLSDLTSDSLTAIEFAGGVRLSFEPLAPKRNEP